MIRPPRLASRLSLPESALPIGRNDRHATWLELFFDLVFVLALSNVQGRLNDPDPNAVKVVITAGLFAVVWWCWIGQAVYDTRFDPDDLPHRLAVLVAMVGAGAMALGASQVPDARLLPIGYLTVRGILIALYFRVRNTSPGTHALTKVYFIGFGLGWLIWFSSLFVPFHLRPVLWIVGLTVELLTPWLGRPRLIKVPVDPSHLPERIGQFSIILLGATLTDLVQAVPRGPSGEVILAAALAFVVPASIWWVYTTFVTTGLALRRLSAGLAYSYVHTFYGVSLLLIGWTLGQVVRQVAKGSAELPHTVRVLLGVSISTWMLSGLAIQLVSVGFLSRRRIGIAVAGVTPVAVIAATVSDPLLTLPLLAVTMIGYAIATSRHIQREGGELGRQE
jgi:low temperature requirement protein LtrA